MYLQTASQVINFAIQLEEKLAKFYERLAERLEDQKDVFLSFAKENRKNKLQIQRAYHEVVSDALETGFSFEGLSVDDDLTKIELNQNEDISFLFRKALDIEDKIQRFYQDAAKRSKSFLADVPRVFERIAKKREARKEKLKLII